MSLVTTIRNEADQLPVLLRSIEDQSHRPSEIIVVDGGSTDGSIEVLERWKERLPISVESVPGANISMGRNIGIQMSTCPLVAVTDAGVRLDPEWLARLVAPFSSDCGDADVVSGFFLPDPQSEFECALAATTLPDVEEIDPGTFLPSSRSVAFRKSWFDAGVRYPEWLDYCEDVVFDLRMKRAGARFIFNPGAFVWFRPRSSPGGYFRQYYLYARGDGKAGLFTRRHVIRYLTYFAGIPSLFLVNSWWWRAIVVAGAAGYMWKPVNRLLARTPLKESRALPRLVLKTALLRGLGDAAKMAGYPVGLIWRARRFGLVRNWRTIPEPERARHEGTI